MSNLQQFTSAAEPEGGPVECIDVSSNNLAVRWDLVTAPIAIVKITEGVDFVDKRAAALCAGAKAAGKLLGGYHFLRVRAGKAQDGAQQARDFAAYYTSYGCTFAFLDVELAENEKASPAEFAQAVREFVAEWKAIINDPLGLYTSPGEAVAAGLGAVPELASLPLWLASYTLLPPASPKPWAPDAWILWQKTGSAKVHGVDGACDLSVCRGTLAQFRAALGLAPSLDASHERAGM